MRLQFVFKFLIGIATSFCIIACQQGVESVVENQEPAFNFFNEKCAYLPNEIVFGQKVTLTDSDRYLSVQLIIENQQQSNKPKQISCSGQLISDRAVLTAGHCLEYAKKALVVFYPSLSCQSGYRKDLHSLESSQFKIHENYFLHNNWKNEGDENPDLGIIYLPKSAPFNYQRVEIAKLNDLKKIFEKKQNNPDSIFENYNFLLLGSGQTNSYSANPGYIQKTNIQKNRISFFKDNIVLDQRSSAGICKGDSGGGLYLISNENYKEPILIGVSSFNILQNQVQSKVDPCQNFSNFVNLGFYTDWINQNK